MLPRPREHSNSPRNFQTLISYICWNWDSNAWNTFSLFVFALLHPTVSLCTQCLWSLQIIDLVWTVCTVKSLSASGDAELFRAVFLNRTRGCQDCKSKAYAALSCHHHNFSFSLSTGLRANSKVENSFELGKYFCIWRIEPRHTITDNCYRAAWPP